MKNDLEAASALVSLVVAITIPWQAANANGLMDTVRGYLNNASQNAGPSYNPNGNYNGNGYNGNGYNGNGYNGNGFNGNGFNGNGFNGNGYNGDGYNGNSYNGNGYNGNGYNGNNFNDPRYTEDRPKSRKDHSEGNFFQEQTTANLYQRVGQVDGEIRAAQSSGKISNNQAAELSDVLARLGSSLHSNRASHLQFGEAQAMVNELNVVESKLQADINSNGANQANNRFGANYRRGFR